MRAWAIVLPEFLLVGVGATAALAWLPLPALAGLHAAALLIIAGMPAIRRIRRQGQPAAICGKLTQILISYGKALISAIRIRGGKNGG